MLRTFGLGCAASRLRHLFAWSALTLGAPVGAVALSPPQCNVFPSNPTQRAVAVVGGQTANDRVTICYLGNEYSDYASVAVYGQRVVVTIYDNTFSYSPNPWIVLGQEVGPLAPADYKVDVIMTAVMPFPGYPLLVASGVPLHVAEATPPDPPMWAIEYYNESLAHYFITSLPTEQHLLDAGGFVGWQRTGYSFRVNAGIDNASVCRFYIPPAQGDSHFYSAVVTECSEVATKFPSFLYEAPSLFKTTLPDLASGQCATGQVPVYRLWNMRPDTNHRYVIDRELRTQMVRAGYVSEGYGPYGVAMCSTP